jgi:hypothetical protein
MFKTKHSYEEFKKSEQDNAALIKRLRSPTPDPIGVVGVYNDSNSQIFIVIGQTIDGKDAPEDCSGPIGGKAIEFFACGLSRGYCADTEEAYNAFLEKVDGKEAEDWARHNIEECMRETMEEI